MDDYTALVTGMTGLSAEQIGAALLWLASAAVVSGLVKPYLRTGIGAARRGLAWLRAKAAGTATRVDDVIVSALTAVFGGVVFVVDGVFWAFAVLVEIAPHFEEAMKRAREAKLLESRR